MIKVVHPDFEVLDFWRADFKGYNRYDMTDNKFEIKFKNSYWYSAFKQMTEIPIGVI